MRTSVVLVLVLVLAPASFCEFRLAPIFTDHMVLQQDRPVPVWGSAGPGEEVTVEFADQKKSGRGDAAGRWQVDLDPLPASASGHVMIVSSTNSGFRFQISDILVGEVWLCSGQSNMRWSLRQSGAAAEDRPGLRWYNLVPADYRGGALTAAQLQALQATNFFHPDGWRPCAANAGDFSAVAYYFGRRLQAGLGRPVGLILNAVGGAPIESFLPRETLAAEPRLRPLLQDWLSQTGGAAWCRARARADLAAWFNNPQGPPPHHPFEPGFLYDAGLRPLLPFALRGAIWYQGESNATDGTPHGQALDPADNELKIRSLIKSWRAAWPDLAFHMVQLPGLNRDWALFREVQAKVAREVPGCGLAVTLDVGHPTDVHPRNKRPVGERLALQALRKTYDQPVAADGPAYAQHRSEGKTMLVGFEHAEGLRTRDGHPPLGFELAGPDGIYHPAAAAIEGATVHLRAAGVARPAAVRYAWADDPPNNLVNGAGLPAAPFRAGLHIGFDDSPKTSEPVRK